jgi:hypothetical protein
MKGGESFGINNTSFGNIIIALNMFKYYIKVDYVEDKDSPKNGVYYFIFNLNEGEEEEDKKKDKKEEKKKKKKNNLVTSFGLTNEILVNGNLDIRNSKTFLDLSIKNDLYNLLLNGLAYKQDSERRTELDIVFEIKSGIPSTLQIELAKNEIPKYSLTLNPEKYPGTANKIGKPKSKSENPKTIDELIKDQPYLLAEYKKVPSTINKDLLITNEEELFLSINSSIDSLDVQMLEELYKLLIDSNNFILEDENINSSYNGVLFIVSQKIPKETKTRLKPAIQPKPIPQPEADTKLVENSNKKFLLADKLTPFLKNQLVQILDKKVNPEKIGSGGRMIKSSYDGLFEYLKNKGYIEDDNTISSFGKYVLLFWRKFVIKFIKDGNKDYLVEYEKLVNIWDSIDEVLKKHPEIDSIEKIESNWQTLFQEMDEQFAERSEPDNKVGGATENAQVLLVNNSEELNVSEFAEPIIYLTSKSPDKIVAFSKIDSKDGKIPVFGYLTVGKQLMLKLLELQTNQRVSFKPEDSKTQKFKNFAVRNPALIIGVATYLFNGFVNYGIDKLGLDFYTVKEMITHVCTTLFGPTAGFILSTTSTWFLPDPKTRASDVGVSKVVKDFWSSAMDYASQMKFPGSSSGATPMPPDPPAGGKKKSRKNIKIKRTKKRGSRKVRRSHRRIH